MKGTCESPNHQGDPLVNRWDLLERRLEWRRLSDQGREHTRIIRRECRRCVNLELFPHVARKQEAMFE